MRATLQIGVLAVILAAPAGFALDVFVNFGGGCPPYSSYSYSCASYPVFFPPYSYAGYAPFYGYYGPYPLYRSGYSSGGGGAFYRLGEQHADFWKAHGGYEEASFSSAPSAVWPAIEVADKNSPLAIGDSESRIRDLDLEIASIFASGQQALYRLADGRLVTVSGGVVIDIASAE